VKKYTNMELSQEQIDIISYFVLNYDIKAYIKSHQKEYKEFLEEKKRKNHN